MIRLSAQIRVSSSLFAESCEATSRPLLGIQGHHHLQVNTNLSEEPAQVFTIKSRLCVSKAAFPRFGTRGGSAPEMLANWSSPFAGGA